MAGDYVTRTWTVWFPALCLGALCLAAAGLIFGGCGAGEDAAPASTAPTPAASTSPTDPASTTTVDEDPTPTGNADGAETTVGVYFSVGDGSDCAEVAMFPRMVAQGPDLAYAALEQLVGGPTDTELEAGAGSFFTAATAGILKSVRLDQGLLVVDFVDFRDQLPNASSSCGSTALLAQLNGTAFQFDSVERIRYEMEGSCDTFAEWLQRDCQEVLRSGQPTGSDGPVGSGCSPGDGQTIPDGRWFGYIGSADADEVSLDVACWFAGEAAIEAAAADGEESPPPNDYHIRNTGDRLRTVPVDGDVQVSWLAEPGDPATQTVISYPTWLDSRSGRSVQPGVWLTVENGTLASIEEQYVP